MSLADQPADLPEIPAGVSLDFNAEMGKLTSKGEDTMFTANLNAIDNLILTSGRHQKGSQILLMHPVADTYDSPTTVPDDRYHRQLLGRQLAALGVSEDDIVDEGQRDDHHAQTIYAASFPLEGGVMVPYWLIKEVWLPAGPDETKRMLELKAALERPPAIPQVVQEVDEAVAAALSTSSLTREIMDESTSRDKLRRL